MPIILTGLLLDVFPTEQITERFRKRIFWLAEAAPKDARYANTWELELHNDACDDLDKYQKLDLLNVEVEIRGRKAQVGGIDRVFNALKCVGIAKVGEQKAHTRPPSYEDRRRERDGIITPRPSNFPYRHQ